MTANIDSNTFHGPTADIPPGSIAEGKHSKVRLSHTAGLARRNRVRTDVETLAVDVELDLSSAYDADGPGGARKVLEQYIADVFGKSGWSLLDYSPIMDRNDGRDIFGVKVNVVEADGLAPEECDPVYLVMRADGEGNRVPVSGQFKREQLAVEFAKNYIDGHPYTTVSVVKFAPTSTVASFGVDEKAPATLFARCILSRDK